MYRADPAQAGLYLPPDGAPRVEPGGEYELRVTSGDAPVVSARTLTPTRVRIEELVWLDEDLDTELQQLRLFSEIGDGVYDARENQLEYPRGLVVALIDDADETGFYQFATFNLERYSPYLLDPEWNRRGGLRAGAREHLPLLRAEDSYLYLPWDGIYHAGRYKVRLYSVDPELVRPRANGQHRRGPQRRRGGPVLPAAPLPVENGIGLFASASVDSFGFFVRPRGSPPCSGCECWDCAERRRRSDGGILGMIGDWRVRYLPRCTHHSSFLIARRTGPPWCNPCTRPCRKTCTRPGSTGITTQRPGTLLGASEGIVRCRHVVSFVTESFLLQDGAGTVSRLPILNCFRAAFSIPG